MPRKMYPAGEAARLLGISLDTLRRWDSQGRIKTKRDAANKRLVPASEVDRILASEPSEISARNHLRGVVKSIRREGLLTQVELQVTEPARVVAIITTEAADELRLMEGADGVAIIKATSVMISR